jgi:hypothetical protein
MGIFHSGGGAQESIANRASGELNTDYFDVQEAFPNYS